MADSKHGRTNIGQIRNKWRKYIMNSISIKNFKHPYPQKVKDVWNAFMAEGAVFGNYDIP